MENKIKISWDDIIKSSNSRDTVSISDNSRYPSIMKANRLLDGKKCSICKTEIHFGEEIVNCSLCELPFHSTCWHENMGCGTYGCKNATCKDFQMDGKKIVFDSELTIKPESSLEKAFNDDSIANYASLWDRAKSSIIDDILMITLFIAVYLIIILIAAAGEQGTKIDSSDFWVPPLLFILFQWFYYAGFESSRFMGTLGKISFGLKVCDVNGNPISFGRASIRHMGRLFVRLLSFIPKMGGLLMIGAMIWGVQEGKKKQNVYDIISGCIVVKR